MKSLAIANLDAAPTESFFERIERLVRARVDMIQLRAKLLDDRLQFEVAARCRSLIPAGATSFLVNGRPDIAIAAGADGVHLPENGLPVAAVRAIGKHLILGRSCHTLKACRQAVEEEADYIVFGPVFDARSKHAPATVSRDDLRAASRLGRDVFALGGISRSNVASLRDAAAGVAAVTLFMHDEPLEEIMEELRAL